MGQVIFKFIQASLESIVKANQRVLHNKVIASVIALSYLSTAVGMFLVRGGGHEPSQFILIMNALGAGFACVLFFYLYRKLINRIEIVICLLTGLHFALIIAVIVHAPGVEVLHYSSRIIFLAATLLVAFRYAQILRATS
jgi:hypothetical protein